MYSIISVLIILACVALVFLVIIQKSKGGGLASNLQGSQAISQQMGTRRATDFVERATWYMIGALAALSFIANMFIETGTNEAATRQSRAASAIQNARPTAPAPADGGGLQPLEEQP